VTHERNAAVAALTLLLSPGGCTQRLATPGPPATQQRDVIFTEYSPLSRAKEILRRALPPLTFRRGQQALSARKQVLAEQAIDVTKERFAVYVPEGAPPPAGYGLLVFVAPWPRATEPRRWRPPLNRHGLILVSAARSGNEVCVFNVEVQLARRLGHEPLDASALDDALDALDRPSAVDPGKLAACNARIERELTAKLAEAEAAIARGDRDAAREQLKAIDGRYGGLAAPAIVELDEKLLAHE